MTKRQRVLVLLMIVIAGVSFSTLFVLSGTNESMRTVSNDTSTQTQSSQFLSQTVEKNVNKDTDRGLPSDSDAQRIANFIDTCLQRAPPPNLTISQVQLNRYFDSLDGHDDQQSHYLHAMYATASEPAERLAKLSAYRETYPSDERVKVEIARLCAAGSSAPDTCVDGVIEDIYTTGSDNGELWLYLANFYASRSDDERVEAAITQLHQTSFFGNRFAASLNDFVRYSHPPADITPQQLLITAVGIQASEKTYPSDLTNWCQLNADNVSRAEQCLQLGQHLRQMGKTNEHKTIGITLETLATSDDERREKLLSSTHSTGTVPEFAVAAALMDVNDRLLFDWLDDFVELGETAAQRRLVKSVKLAAKSGICGS